jgi:anti-sigma regulatory factor (Ser/Thr protein kinase)
VSPAAGERYFASLTVPARVESIRAAAAFLVQAARGLKVPAAGQPTFEIAIVEALTNALKHGRTGDPARATIVCELELEGRSLVVRILDSGPGFTLPPLSLPGVSRENVMAIPEAGYGIPVIQSVFPKVRTVTREDRFGLELPLEI